MAHRFRRLHRLREEVVKITRRFFQFCCVCGTVEEGVRTDVVPVRKVLEGNITKARLIRSNCDHGKRISGHSKLPGRLDKSGSCSTTKHEKHVALSSDLSLSDCLVENGTEHVSGSTQTEVPPEYSKGEFWSVDNLRCRKVKRTLKRGPHGRVELVSFPEDPKRYVLKTRDAEASLTEFSSLALCQSRFVVDLCASVVLSDKRLMFQKNYSHGDLGQLLARDKPRELFSEKVAVWTAANLYSGVDYLHANEILHLNINPGNILIDEHGYTVLTGFGKARHRENCLNPLEKGELTTAAYVSPELLRRQLPDKMADFWAIGCVLYEIIKGNSPFLGRSDAETEAKVSMGRLTNVYGLSSAALNFITRELNVYQNQRICVRGGVAAIMRQPLFRHINWDSFRCDRLPGYSPLLGILLNLPEAAPSDGKRKPSTRLDALQNQVTSCEESDVCIKTTNKPRRRRRRRASASLRRRLCVIDDGYLGDDEDDVLN